jgi:hypothetical protein
VRFPYLVGRARLPQPSLGGSLWRSRPIIAVRLIGPGADRLTDGLLDTGADDTVFPEWVATLVGVDLTQAEERQVGLAGRKPIHCRYASVRLRITDGSTIYEWVALVGFVTVSLSRPLLGHAGFLQFFDAEFHGANQEVILTPNRSFPGTTSASPGPP